MDHPLERSPNLITHTCQALLLWNAEVSGCSLVTPENSGQDQFTDEASSSSPKIAGGSMIAWANNWGQKMLNPVLLPWSCLDRLQCSGCAESSSSCSQIQVIFKLVSFSTSNHGCVGHKPGLGIQLFSYSFISLETPAELYTSEIASEVTICKKHWLKRKVGNIWKLCFVEVATWVQYTQKN